ncbi:MAG: hypothetical protein HY532_07035 [Chloroflexi bacterium]|nr:hypothetical protein [Chloroflexota bacterium]
MNASIAQKGFISLALLQSLIYLAFAVSIFLALDKSHEVSRLNGLIPLGMAAVMLSGLWVYLKRPKLGGLIVLVAAALSAAMTFWTLFTPVLAIVSVVFWAMSYRTRRGTTAA